MAIYHLSVKYIQRSKGRSATASAAYRSGERIRDTREDITHDYRKRSGVSHKETLTPYNESIDRSKLWNLAEASEKRKDASTAKEYEIALPEELTPEQRIQLTRDFATYLIETQGCAVDICIHEPGKGDMRNHHAHLLCTTREYEKGGTLGKKCKMELSDRDLKKLNLPGRKSFLADIRTQWERLANGALARAGFNVTVDARSHKERGIITPPTVHLGPTAAAMRRRGLNPDRAKQEMSPEIKEMVDELARLENQEIRVTSAHDRIKERRAAKAAAEEAKKQREREALERERKREFERIRRDAERGNREPGRGDFGR